MLYKISEDDSWEYANFIDWKHINTIEYKSIHDHCKFYGELAISNNYCQPHSISANTLAKNGDQFFIHICDYSDPLAEINITENNLQDYIKEFFALTSYTNRNNTPVYTLSLIYHLSKYYYDNISHTLEDSEQNYFDWLNKTFLNNKKKI